jgi:NADPH:quinone reductase-like Zn-dependent oxidoreductase
MATRSSSSKMRALIAPAYVTPDKYEIVELLKAEIKGPRHVLVQVHAASINPHDVKQAKGMMKILEKLEYNIPLVSAFDL